MKEAATRSTSNWYVVQVTTGAEERMCKTIEKVCADFDAHKAEEKELIGLKSCFSPRFACRKKRMGNWYDLGRTLLPGYVIADARHPEKLAQALRGVREFCRLLTNGEAYLSLNKAERLWIESKTSEDDRTIPLSFGYREGDVLIVSSGPLAGRETMITRFDRRNCMAHVEFHAGPMTFKTTVGLVLEPGGGLNR